MDHVKLQRRMETLYLLEPNDLGYVRLTKIYRKITKHLKMHPWARVLPLTTLFVVALTIYVGRLVVQLASILQKGF